MKTRQSFDEAGNVTLPGLEKSAEILVDTHGVPHIYAQTRHDAYLLQGFNAARDRLWQIDFWRRRGLGLMAEAFGPDHAERDRVARLFLYQGDMDTEWAAYGPGAREACRAFAEGVNAYIEMTEQDPELLPPEFRELGYTPARWTAEDICRMRSHGLFYNATSEVERATVLARFGETAENLRKQREPAIALTVPEGLSPQDIPPDVLRLYTLLISPSSFTGPEAGTQPTGLPKDGSNNWVLAGSRTDTGRPILANDPHRAMTTPSLRYIAHLNAPGLNVIGAGEPGLPGISIGHNDDVAFGLTICPMDQEDLYIYDVHPERPDEYRHQGQWRPFTVERETIAVNGAEPVTVELKYTVHGPVIHQDDSRHKAYALRVAWLEPGMAPYLASLGYQQAADITEFRAALTNWGGPPVNQVFADRHGDIGWQIAGLLPVREGWDGTLPVPGDGRFEWRGFLRADTLPGTTNPDGGWLGSANQMNIPAEFSERYHVGYDWYSGQRMDRIEELLGRPDRLLSVQDSWNFQEDCRSVPARQLLSLLTGLPEDIPGVALLRGWDGELAPDSAAAALFEVWYRRHLRPELLRAALRLHLDPAEVEEALPLLLPDETYSAESRTDLAILHDPEHWLGPEAASVLSGVAARTLASAHAETASLLGADETAWRWGTLHRALMRHPLHAALSDSARDDFTVGPLPRGGSGDTVLAAPYGPDFVQTGGASWRMVVDVGGWENSRMINTPGQSGDSRSPHYADLFEKWADGGSIPMLFDRRAVDESTELRLGFEPLA
ncbi:penicillin acylase family protein [Streptomyces sp. NPDC057580]|uniref:penicillin acylase family protein n=1 Tax=Streptomyces sp. NPDC057580 TaxID=3346173 RepID=UPI0036770C6B